MKQKIELGELIPIVTLTLHSADKRGNTLAVALSLALVVKTARFLGLDDTSIRNIFSAAMNMPDGEMPSAN